MERFNPFSVDIEHDPFTTSFNRSSESYHQAAAAAAANEVTNRSQAQAPTSSQTEQKSSAGASTTLASPSRYSTSFPDPFGELPPIAGATSTTTTATSSSDEPGRADEPSPGRVAAAAAAATAAGSTSRPGGSSRAPITSTVSDRPIQMGSVGNRSNSVTFAPMSHSVDDISSPSGPHQARPASRRQEPGGGGGLSSFLSRATSVTSSTVTDRVSGAVGSVRSAVDSLSSQLQQAVPSNLNERLSSNFMGGGGGDSLAQAQQQQPAPQAQQQQQQQSAASYLASKLSSATNQFSTAAAGAQSPNSLPVISRQRVVLILDSLGETDWAQQFNSYRRLIAGLGPAPSSTSTAQSTLSSFFSQATAQLSSSASAAAAVAAGGGANATASLDSDLIEQVDFRDISVLANQSTATATVMVRPSQQSAAYSLQSQQQQQSSSSSSSPFHQQLSRTNSQSLGRVANQAAGFRLIRPEYVVVRQRTKDKREQLSSIVSALNYCLVPMFEPPEVWSVFHDRQLLFSKLLRIQRTLGRENFPLIPQCFCQTQQDLLNYINSSSSVGLPCLVRVGPAGQGKIRIDNQQMFRDFSTIMASSGLSCTVEPFLDVKCDLIIQKFGTSLKSFRKNVKRAPPQQPPAPPSASGQPGQQAAAAGGALDSDFGPYSAADFRSNAGDFNSMLPPSRQSASRQTSLGSSVLSSLMQSATSTSQQQQQQQLARRSSNPAALAYEKVAEVNVRYRAWLEAIEREFDHKIQAFCIKVVVASNDREYIVGLADCGMDFLGTLDNQDEDKRSFVELIISHMNTNLPKSSGSNLIGGREASLNPAATSNESSAAAAADASRSDDKATAAAAASAELMRLNLGGGSGSGGGSGGGEKRKFTSQTQIDGDPSRSGLGNRSQSVSVNQSDFLKGENLINKSAGYFNRRGSDRSDSLTDTEAGSMGSSMGGPANSAAGLHQRQASLGQSFFDQTSTALSSFQKQSMSFFKRFDAQAPQSASGPASGAATPVKSERSFPMSTTSAASTTGAGPAAGAAAAGAKAGNGFKSQSVDSSSFEFGTSKPAGARKSPPKPPPPPSAQSLMNRQSSLASYSTVRSSPTSTTTPSSSRVQTRQNSATSDGSQAQRNRVVRQNSALSAFEPYDPELSAAAAAAATARQHAEPEAELAPAGQQQQQAPVNKPQHVQEMAAKKSANYDSASMTSGDSTSTSETGTGEDTMNNLKKTFASIFGDKCD